MKYALSFLIIIAAFQSNAQKVLNLDSFTEVALNTAGTVYITIGDEYRVEVDGDEEALEDADIYVRGNTLVIDSDDDWSWFGGNDSDDLVVNVTAKKIEGLKVSGSGKLIVKNTISTEELYLAVSGSGRMELAAKAKETEVGISGSGKIYLKGSGETMSVKISGSGRIKAEDFSVKECKASISGSGSCEITVEDKIDARISGSGSIYYKGDPEHVNTSASGSGKVRKM